MSDSIDTLYGIYNAEGSLGGELRYVWGRLRGTAHCALCDITHRGVREKRSFKDCRGEISVPLELLHLDELSPALKDVVGSRAPCVVARSGDALRIILDDAALRECGGDVERFRRRLEEALAQLNEPSAARKASTSR